MRLPLLFICALTLGAQEHNQAPPDLWREVDQLGRAIDSGDWQQAARHSSELKTLVIDQRDAALRFASMERIGQVLSWLPADTEAVVVSQQPFTLTERDRDVTPGALVAAQGYVLNLLRTADEGRFAKPLQGSTIRFAVLAGRKFGVHPSDGSDAMPLGMIAWEGCAVYAFGAALTHEALPKSPDTVIGAHQVWSSTGKDYTQATDATPRRTTYLAALIKPDELLVCNHKGFFSAVLEHVSGPPVSSAFERLPEWAQVDRTAPLWALRHYGVQTAEHDPTDLRAGNMLGFTDDGAVGLVFQVGHPAGKVQARLLTRSAESPLAALAANPEFGAGVAVRRVGEGGWEYTADDEHGHGFSQVFMWMGLLGFMVLV